MGSPDPSEVHARYRAPGRTSTLDALLARVHPTSTAADREALARRRAVRVEGSTPTRGQTRVPGGAGIELLESFGDEPKPEEAAELQALVPALPWAAGTLAKRRGMQGAVAFERLDRRDGVDRLLLRQGDPGASARFARDALVGLAAAGHPVLGDRRGGVLVEGGLQLGTDSPAWPDEPVFPSFDSSSPGVRATEPPVLAVSQATARIVSRGHPWVLRDDDTGPTARFAPGTPVRLRGPDGRELGTAHVEGEGSLVARVFVEPAAGGGSPPRKRSASPHVLAGSVGARVDRALARREGLFENDAETDVFRLVHGECDGLPGLFVDRLGPVLRVLATSTGDAAYREEAVERIGRAVGERTGVEPALVEVVHLRDVPPGQLLRTRLLRGPLPERDEAGRFEVRERGLSYRVDPGLGEPLRSTPGFGLFPDQRENRSRLVAAAPGRGRMLNLFSHTGAFSVAWLAGPEREAVSVDLSGAYLRWLDANLAANAIDLARHRSVRQDGRRFVEALDRSERFDAIVVDPPTAAAAGRRFWSVGRDLPVLVERVCRHLAPGGRLLVCRNDRRRGELRGLVEEAAGRARVRLASIEAAGPGRDFPARKGFPEGAPFSGVLATRG